MTSGQDSTSLFNKTYDATHKTVLALITAKCGSTEDIRDLFQKTYMALFQTIERKGMAYPKDANRLVFKIAKRKIADHYAHRARQLVVISSLTADDDSEGCTPPELATDPFFTEDIALDAVAMEQAEEYLRRKPRDVRKIFYLFFHLDLSIPEIAKQMSLKESNVKNKLYRTINELKALFDCGKVGTK